MAVASWDRPPGPGLVFHVWRNAVAMMGIRPEVGQAALGAFRQAWLGCVAFFFKREAMFQAEKTAAKQSLRGFKGCKSL